MLFFLFIPLTLAFALVFSPDLRAGLFYATALSLNWLLGAGSYFLLPVARADLRRAGRVRAAAGHRRQRACRRSCSSSGWSSCATRRAGTAQSIGAFASLHVSIFFTAALAPTCSGSAGA